METDYPHVDDIVVKSEDSICMDKTSRSPSKSPSKSNEGREEAESPGIGGITMVTCATGAGSHSATPVGTPPGG